jgi:aryl-alcohol dehydrogenase-like predicted oxidoreductase
MNDKQDRRDFIAKPLQWVAASTLLGGLESSLLASPAKSAKPIYRTLGKTGISLPVVNMGVMNADVPGLIRRAYELGMRHFDTAAVYQQGRNEEMVGNMIKEMGVRDKVIISTKVMLRGGAATSPQAGEVFRRNFEASLKRLQMDHVDILYYHAVDSAEGARAEGPIAALAALKKEGKTRFTGISTHRGEPILNEAMRLGVYDVVLVTINYTMASDKGLLDAIDRAAKQGIGIVAMKTQAGGLAKPDAKMPANLPPHSQTALLKWVLQNKSITTAIPGFSTYEQLEQNFTVAGDLAFTAAEKDFLSDKSFTAEAQFCRQCGQCRPDCPLHVDIPTLMRSHMYAVQYSNRRLAVDTLASIETGRGLDACHLCPTCNAACRNNVNIGRKIEQLKELRLAPVARA